MHILVNNAEVDGTIGLAAVQPKLTVPEPTTDMYWSSGFELFDVLQLPLLVLGRTAPNCPVMLIEPVMPA